MDEKTLVIYYDNGIKPIFRDSFNESGIRCRSWLKNNMACLVYALADNIKITRKIVRYLVYDYPEDRDGLIIIFDTKVTAHYLRTLRKKNPGAKIILWYWNEVSSGSKPMHLNEIDTWSYSPADCMKYGLLYNSQFYFDSIVERYRSVRDQGKMQGEQSFIFIGRDKGRSDKIRKISDDIKKSGWGCDTELLSTRKFDWPVIKNEKYSPGFGYKTYMEKILKYRGILDVAYKENSGLSLRTMESIFFHKKLITTNPLVTSYDFYDENNIFVWGHSSISLEEFLSRPYRPVPDHICETYLISSWLSRMKTYYEM